MDADELLRNMRKGLEYMDRGPADTESMDDAELADWWCSRAERLAKQLRDLDSYLSQGGTPPTAWSEGPDVPDEHIYVPLGPPNPADGELPETHYYGDGHDHGEPGR